jgi:hypothetical protein
MLSTLDAQKRRLMVELSDAQLQVVRIRKSPCPDFKMLNYYLDVIERNKQLVDMINCHLFQENQNPKIN